MFEVYEGSNGILYAYFPKTNEWLNLKSKTQIINEPKNIKLKETITTTEINQKRTIPSCCGANYLIPYKLDVSSIRQWRSYNANKNLGRLRSITLIDDPSLAKKQEVIQLREKLFLVGKIDYDVSPFTSKIEGVKKPLKYNQEKILGVNLVNAFNYSDYAKLPEEPSEVSFAIINHYQQRQGTYTKLKAIGFEPWFTWINHYHGSRLLFLTRGSGWLKK